MPMEPALEHSLSMAGILGNYIWRQKNRRLQQFSIVPTMVPSEERLPPQASHSLQVEE